MCARICASRLGKLIQQHPILSQIFEEGFVLVVLERAGCYNVDALFERVFQVGIQTAEGEQTAQLGRVHAEVYVTGRRCVASCIGAEQKHLVHAVLLCNRRDDLADLIDRIYLRLHSVRPLPVNQYTLKQKSLQQQKVVRKISKFIEFTPEQKERAATVDLEEFLLRQGEKLIKSGREKRLASDHSITVRGCEWFDHASNEGGRAVSFVQKYYGKSYVEAMSMLLGESMEPVYPQAKKQEADSSRSLSRRLFRTRICTACLRILLKTRGLDADVVSYFARRKLLYEDAAHHNAVFIGTDEGGCPRHAHLRSTNSFGKAFRLNVESSDPRYSFHHTGTDGSLYVFEAPIDMLSYISMNPQQWQEHSYVACCGTSPIPVMQMLKPDTQIVYLCLDNDDAGHKASERMAELSARTRRHDRAACAGTEGLERRSSPCPEGGI